MRATGTLNFRKLSILMLAAVVIVAMSAGAAKAQWSVNIVFTNSSNAVVYDVRFMPNYEPNRFVTPNILAGYKELYPGEYFSFVYNYPRGVAPCVFYVTVYDRNGVVKSTEADLCAPVLNSYPGFLAGRWRDIVYLG